MFDKSAQCNKSLMRVVLGSRRAPEKVGSGSLLKIAPPYSKQVWRAKGEV